MTNKEVFEKVMKEVANLALATSNDNKPNVRIVTFAYDFEKQRKIYFLTFKTSKKVTEFENNPNICAMPLPEGENEENQVRIFGKVSRSEKSFEEIGRLLVEKLPAMQGMVDLGPDVFDAYEINFDKAFSAVGMDPSAEVSF